MATGILGLGSSGSTSLNQDLIDKLKEAEREATVASLEDRIDAITRVSGVDDAETDGEAVKLAAITSKANELLEAIKPFDLYVTGGVSAFDQKSASTSGTSVVFDAASESSLNVGTTTVYVEQLAKRDVWASDNSIDTTVKEADIDQGNLIITVDGADFTFSTDGKNYEELVTEINYNSKLTASMEQVGDDEFKLVIKSADSGEANALTFSGNASVAFGFTTGNDIDGYVEVSENHVQTAQNLLATVNGIDYDVSSNTITVDGGLKITAVEEDSTSTITVENDPTTISDYLQYFVNTYNELVALVDDELYSADSPMEDSAALRSMMEGIKGKLFGTYGTDESLSVFSFGFELDKDGTLSLDTDKLSKAIENNFDDLKSLFLGVAEDEGLGTQLKTYIDALDGFEGILYTYEENMNSRQTSLEEEKTKAEEALDTKYELLAAQFASYTALITQMENSFSGLSLMIQQSVASN